MSGVALSSLRESLMALVREEVPLCRTLPPALPSMTVELGQDWVRSFEPVVTSTQAFVRQAMPQVRQWSSTAAMLAAPAGVALLGLSVAEAGAAAALGVVALGTLPGLVVWQSGLGQQFADWLVPVNSYQLPPSKPVQNVALPGGRPPIRVETPPARKETWGLPPTEGSDTYRGDRPEDLRKERMEVVSPSGPTLPEDDLAQKFYLWCLKQGFVFGEDMKAVVVAALLRLGETGHFDLTNYLVLKHNLGLFGAIVASNHLVALEKSGDVGLARGNGVIQASLKDHASAERWLNSYKRESLQAAMALGLIPRPQSAPLPEPTEDPQELIQRTIRVREIATEVTNNPQNEEAVRRAEKLLRKLKKRQRLSDEKVRTFERQAGEMQALNHPRPVVVSVSDAPIPPGPAEIPPVRAARVQRTELEGTLAELDLRMGQLRGKPGFTHGEEFMEMEAQVEGWRARPESARSGDVWRALRQTRRWSRELSESTRRAAQAEEATTTRRGNGIRFENFPKNLEFEEAARILTRNGFVMRAGGKKSHYKFTHPRVDVAVTMSRNNSMQNTPKERVGQVKKGLRELATRGEEVVW